MSANANLKCKFAKLKYEQLLADKYFVESCFSHRYTSYTAKQELSDLAFEIGSVIHEPCSFTTTVEEPSCDENKVFSNEFSNEFE